MFAAVFTHTPSVPFSRSWRTWPPEEPWRAKGRDYNDHPKYNETQVMLTDIIDYVLWMADFRSNNTIFQPNHLAALKNSDFPRLFPEPRWDMADFEDIE